MKQKIIAQGAEAKIYLIKGKIVKDRFSKKYRIPELDNKIRTRRTKAEAKLLTKASKIIPAPKPLTDPGQGRMIHMPYIEGIKLSQELSNFDLKEQKQILKQIGQSVSKLHKEGLIHGDLTTSNMIYAPTKKNRGDISKPIVYFIDFGLGFHSNRDEDKAVDLHVLKQALEAKHFENYKTLFTSFKSGYKNKKVLDRLIKVEKRGRYKH